MIDASPRDTDSLPPAPHGRSPVLAFLAALRPKQWTKNLLLFAGLLFTLDQRHTSHDFLQAVLGFLLFCGLSSVVYLVNDIVDRDADRLHPKKRNRPIACGELSIPAAAAGAAVLGVFCLFFCFVLGWEFGAVACVYFLLTALYSFRFKHVVIVDVLALAAGFVLRAMAGAVLIHVVISPWLILCTLMLALFLGLSKRRAELLALERSGGGTTRRILTEYSAELLDQMIVIVTSGCLMSYALYTIESPAAGRHQFLMLTIPFVIYGIFRYLYLMHRRQGGESPDAVLLEDRPLLVSVVLWGLTTALIVTHALTRVMALLPH